MEGSDLVGKRTVFVHQETEAPLLFQQSLLTAVSDEQLHVHLAARQRFQALTKHKQFYENMTIFKPIFSHLTSYKPPSQMDGCVFISLATWSL